MAESMADGTSGRLANRNSASLSSHLGLMVLAYWIVACAVVITTSFQRMKNSASVLLDNDDNMRLLEIRDLLAGQSWFDLMQYRLGLPDGTLMHWSRLIDLPIATLIRLYGLFFESHRAEQMAASTWPLLLIPLLLLPLAIAARRVGGVATMHIALALGVFFLFSCIRFAPGSIDHHNVQLVLAMWMAATLTDTRRRVASYAGAGLVCALAIAIGAETMPLVAVACLCVALQWIWHGRAFAGAARTFGLSLALSITALFVLTIPPHAYAVVTCDNLSLGFYSLSALGGAGLFLLASLPGTDRRFVRVALAAVMGGVLLIAARIIAPQCLGDPLGSLDPMLVQLWLRGVSEARSFAAEALADPGMVGGFYAVGLFAIGVCLFRAIRGDNVEFHLVLLALAGVSWAVALMQVRGAFFANMFGILPLALLISDLRRVSARNPQDARVAIGYIAGVLAAVPAVWAVSGLLIVKGVPKDFGLGDAAKGGNGTETAELGECGAPEDMAMLAAMPTGVVAAPSNSGSEILLNTSHRVLSAPYHRNQQGMLTELYIGLAQPGEARAFLNGAGVTVLAFCDTDPQTKALMKMKPDGLYAALTQDKVPDYLEPAGIGSGRFRFYKVKPVGK